MAKAYWVAIYRSTPNPEAHAAYVKLAVPALTAHGAPLSRARHARAWPKLTGSMTARAIRQRSRRSTMRRNGISASSRGSHDRPLMSAFGTKRTSRG